MVHSLQYLFYFILLILCSSCEKIIDFDEEESKPVLTISGFVSDVDLSYLDIGSSVSILSSDNPQFISNATATLFRDGENLGDFELTNAELGKYTFPLVLEEAGEYEVQISSGNFKEISSITSIPSKLQGVEAEVLEVNSSGGSEVRLRFIDNPSSDDFYHMFVGFSSDGGSNFFITWFGSNSEYLISDEFGFSFEEDLNYFYDRAIFSDQLFPNNEVVIDFEISIPEEETAYIQLVKSSEEYYNYFKSIHAYQGSGGPFSQPVQLFDNVTDGLGVFAGYSYELIEIEQ
ncbi:MAG: hypothetical protein ACI9N1_002580 [Flavobacteriales bacterium]|jgi:hypothetical protein